MLTFHIYDGTRDPRYGRALGRALSELERYQQVIFEGPTPGTLEEREYDIVRDAERQAGKDGRIVFPSLLHHVIHHPIVGGPVDGIDTVVLTERELYLPSGNRVLSGAVPDERGNGYLVLSTGGDPDEEFLGYLALRNLGHIYGAVRRDAVQSGEFPGCKHLCVMQEKPTIPEMLAQAFILGARSRKFCKSCGDNLRAYRA